MMGNPVNLLFRNSSSFPKHKARLIKTQRSDFKINFHERNQKPGNQTPGKEHGKRANESPAKPPGRCDARTSRDVLPPNLQRIHLPSIQPIESFSAFATTRATVSCSVTTQLDRLLPGFARPTWVPLRTVVTLPKTPPLTLTVLIYSAYPGSVNSALTPPPINLLHTDARPAGLSLPRAPSEPFQASMS